jgi:glucokinase
VSKIVFDIGGTHMRVAKVNNGNLCDISKIHTPSEKKDGLAKILTLINKIAPTDVGAIVGGMAGVISKDGKVLKSPNLPGWNDCDLAGFLKENITGNVSVYNDALMSGLGEATYGAGKDKSIVAYIGLGTGVGGSRIVNRTLDSATGFEPGHHIVDFSNLESWDQKISGHVLQERYEGYPQEKLEDEIYEKYTRIIAVGTHNIIMLWSPDVVVMGGSLITGQNAFRISDIVREINKLNRTFPILPPIRQSILGDDAGLYGASNLF